MTRQMAALGVGVLCIAFFGWARPENTSMLAQTPQAPPAAAATRAPRNADEFEQMFRQITNWGRWGANDQRGASNLITEATRKRALALAKTGESVSLARTLMTEKADDNGQPFEQTMSIGMPQTFGVATDTFKITYHGYAHSHLDAFCHLSYKGQTYNGYARDIVLTPAACTELGVDQVKNGIITRGVLIDIPRLKNVPYLEPGTPIYVEDLEAWERKAGVKIGAGDAIFVRTGRWARREKVGAWNVARNAAGLHASVAPWMKTRGVAFVGSDVAQDVVPSLVDGVGLPVHSLLLVSLGINLMDNLDLEAVATTAARVNRWEFLMTIAPLPVSGGTGSPVNPLAVF